MQRVKTMIRSARRQQLGVRSALDDLSPLEHENLVGMDDRREPVGDHEYRPPAQQSVHRLLHQPLRLGIERRSGLVEDEDRWIPEQGPCNRQSLPLSAGQSRSPLAENRGVAVGELGDEGVRVRGAGRGLDLLVGVRQPPSPYAMLFRTESLKRTVSWLTIPVSERSDGSLILARVDAVDEDRALTWLVESRNQIDERALPAPLGPTSATTSPFAALNEMFGENRRIAVGEADVLEAEPPGRNCASSRVPAVASAIPTAYRAPRTDARPTRATPAR